MFIHLRKCLIKLYLQRKVWHFFSLILKLATVKHKQYSAVCLQLIRFLSYFIKKNKTCNRVNSNKLMDSTGEQLHPNWRALATVHIPIKRFIKEGDQETHKGTHDKQQAKYEVLGVKGDEIKEFYEHLINKQDSNETTKPIKQNIFEKLENVRKEWKKPFDVKKYFLCATNNNVQELKEMNCEDSDINICDDYGWTSLMMASCEGSYDAVEFLLRLGVDKDVKDKTGRNARDLAFKRGHTKIVQLLAKDLTEQKVRLSNDNKTEYQNEPFFCNTCKQNFVETNRKEHETSTIHQFNMKSDLPVNKLQKFNISARNKGLQLMVKQGWDKESGLGPSQSGRLYPVKTVIRKQRSGLGIEQEEARVTHFQAFDRKAVQRLNSDFYKKKPRNRNDIKRDKVREWKRDRRLRNDLK